VYCGLGLVLSLPMALLNLPDYIPLSMDHRTTEGTITKLEPENHNSVYYQFVIGGQTYEGAETRANEFVNGVGRKITVFYHPKSPAKSSISQPYDLLVNELITLGLIVLIFPGLVLITLRQKK
jgi:hypothetical protein